MSPEPSVKLTSSRAVLVLAALACVCAGPLLSPGWFESHEAFRPIARALGAWYEVADGDLYPRWLSTGYLGKGVPLFNFYPPAFSLSVAWGHALGIPLLLAAKLACLLLFFLGALGTFLWTRRHFGPWPALGAGVLYLFAPYHFVDLYVRGAMAEFTALAAFPWLFLAMDGLLERPAVRWLAGVAASSAAVVLSHSLGALMIAPFAAAYAAARAAGRGGWPAFGRVVAGGVLGACLSAFFWLPVIAERGELSPDRIGSQLDGYYSPFRHFVRPAQWLDPAWGFGDSGADGYADGMSFQVGPLLVLTALLALLLARRVEREERRFVLLAMLLGAAALWLTTAASAPWYLLLPPYRAVQFPWRFLGPATLFLAASGAGFFRVAAARGGAAGPLLVGATVVASLALSAPQRQVSGTLAVADRLEAIEAAVASDPWSARFGNGDEYLPREASVDGAMERAGGPHPWGMDAEVGPVSGGTKDITFEVTAPDGQGVVVVPWYRFPGWKVSLDGQERELVPGPDGFIAFLVPQGRHVARVHFGTTPPRVSGWVMAGVGAAVLAFMALRERSRGRADRPHPAAPVT